MKPRLIKGGLSVDDRGLVGYVNHPQFKSIKRLYFISNHEQGFVRAWHGHKHEAKYVMAVQGSVLMGVVKIDNWESPAPESQVQAFALSDSEPSVLYIPKGYANGFKTLTSDAKLLVLSTARLEDSLLDDYRFNARYWNIWGQGWR